MLQLKDTRQKMLTGQADKNYQCSTNGMLFTVSS